MAKAACCGLCRPNINIQSQYIEMLACAKILDRILMTSITVKISRRCCDITQTITGNEHMASIKPEAVISSVLYNRRTRSSDGYSNTHAFRVAKVDRRTLCQRPPKSIENEYGGCKTGSCDLRFDDRPRRNFVGYAIVFEIASTHGNDVETLRSHSTPKIHLLDSYLNLWLFYGIR